MINKGLSLCNTNLNPFFRVIDVLLVICLLLVNSHAYSKHQNNFDNYTYLEDLYSNEEQSIYDPLENVNRKVYRFNTIVDELALKPIAALYGFAMPGVAKKRVNSVLLNLQEPLYTLHGLLMLNPKQTFHSLFRFVINSTFGILGLFDVASLNNLKSRETTFGEVLAYYNIKPGPYLVLPILGPSTFRNGIGTGMDILINPIDKIKNSRRFNYARYGLMVISKREALLDSSKMLRETSLDSYAMVRSIYLQKLKDNYE